jgi:hypothetical protein
MTGKDIKMSKSTIITPGLQIASRAAVKCITADTILAQGRTLTDTCLTTHRIVNIVTCRHFH